MQTKELLLQAIKQINRKYEEIERVTGSNFNILSLSKFDTKEELHSNIIANLLSYSEEFLRLFLKQIGLGNQKEKFIINREHYIDENGRRIDIVLESKELIIGIEVKVYSGDRDNQLNDYYKYLKDKNKNFELFYLTLFGVEADKSSADDSIEYTTISFSYDIINWLESCTKEVVEIANVREGLILYKNLLLKLTKQNRQKESEMIELIKSSEDIKAMNEIYNEYSKVWANKEYDFWVDVFDKVAKNISESWEDGDIDIYNIWIGENGEEFETEDIINNIVCKKERGIVFKKVIDDIVFFVGLEYKDKDKNIYKWVIIEKNGEPYLNEFKEIFNNKKFEESEISFWKYCDNELRFYKSDNLTFEIFDKNQYKKYINNFANELVKLIKKVDELK